LIDERPDARGKDEAERGPRVAVEGELRRPRGLGVAGKRRVEPLRVAVERVLAAAEQITHALGGQRGADESLVHPVTRDRVDEAGGAAARAAPRGGGGPPGPAGGQATPARAGPAPGGAPGPPEGPGGRGRGPRPPPPPPPPPGFGGPPLGKPPPAPAADDAE